MRRTTATGWTASAQMPATWRWSMSQFRQFLRSSWSRPVRVWCAWSLSPPSKNTSVRCLPHQSCMGSARSQDPPACQGSAPNIRQQRAKILPKSIPPNSRRCASRSRYLLANLRIIYIEIESSISGLKCQVYTMLTLNLCFFSLFFPPMWIWFIYYLFFSIFVVKHDFNLPFIILLIHHVFTAITYTPQK